MSKIFNWKSGALISLAAVISLVSIGVAYAANGNPNSFCAFSWAYSNDDGAVGKASGFPNGLDPDDNGNDPQAAQAPGAAGNRADGNIASTAVSYTADSITFALNNAYSGYFPTIFFGLVNQWTTPGVVRSIEIRNPSPDLIAVSLNGISQDRTIAPGQEITGSLSIDVGDIPQNTQSTSYVFSLSFNVSQSTGPDQALAISTTSLPSSNTGATYSQALGVVNGNPPFTWSLSSGQLPAGLTLNAATGVISGVPAAAGTFGFSVQVTDSTADSAVAGLVITILSPGTTSGGGTSGGGVSGAGITTPVPSSSPAVTPVPASTSVPAPPGGNTAGLDNPPGGSTAGMENPPGGNTAGLENPPGEDAPELDNPAAAINPPETAQAPIDMPSPLSSPSLSPQSGAHPAPASPGWRLISGLIAAVLLIACLAIFFSRRKRNPQ